MTSLAQRQTLLPLIDKACHDGARLAKACRQIGLSARTVHRWQRPDRQQGDRRMAGQRAVACPANQLSEAERHAGLDHALRRARAQVYEKARQSNPLRWSGQTRDWSYVDSVHLNHDTPQNKEPQTIQKAA